MINGCSSPIDATELPPTRYTNQHYLAKVNRIFFIDRYHAFDARSVQYACNFKLHFVYTLIQHGTDRKRLSNLGQTPSSNMRMKPFCSHGGRR